MLFIYELTILALFLVPLFYYRVIKESDWETTIKELLPFNKDIKKEVIGSIALFVLLFLGFIVIAISISAFDATTGSQINDLQKVENYLSEELQNSLLGFLVLMIVVVFIEEFFFRSFLLKKFGIFTSTAIFTFFHIGYGSIAEVIGVFFLGLILAFWFNKNKSIIQNYFGHLLYNLLAIILYLFI